MLLSAAATVMPFSRFVATTFWMTLFAELSSRIPLPVGVTPVHERSTFETRLPLPPIMATAVPLAFVMARC